MVSIDTSIQYIRHRRYLKNIYFPLLFSYDETLASWFYYDFTNGETQWNHPLDDIFKEKVIKAREQIAQQTIDPSNASETEQSLDLPKDIEKKQSINQNQITNIKDTSEDLKLKKKLLLEVDENTEISVDTNEILEPQSENNMMPLAPLGPIGSKKPLAPLKKLSPLGSIDKPPLRSTDQTPLSLIGKKTSLEKDKSPLYKDILKQSTKSDNNVPECIDKSPKRGLKGLKLGMGKTFLKSDSFESQERGEDSDVTSVRSGASGGSGRGILRGENLLRHAMMQREEKRIMFDLDSNVQFASEVK